MKDPNEIAIRHNIIKEGFLLLGCLIFVYGGISILNIDFSDFWSSLGQGIDSTRRGGIIAAGIAFFGLGSLVSFIDLLDRRPQIRLTKEYLFYRQNQFFSPYSYLTEHKIPWSEIDYLYQQNTTFKHYFRLPAKEYAYVKLPDHVHKPHKKRWNPLAKLNSGILETDICLCISNYDQTPLKIMSAMKDFHARFK